MDPFFSKEEEHQLLEAIRSAEKKTSGEIKLHVETECSGDVYQRAQEVFFALGLEKTAQRNAVLIYWAKGSRKMAILGDEGLNTQVPDDFWQSTKDKMIAHFRENQPVAALVAGITQAGVQLQTFFPYLDNDQNEIPNDISFG